MVFAEKGPWADSECGRSPVPSLPSAVGRPSNADRTNLCNGCNRSFVSDAPPPLFHVLNSGLRLRCSVQGHQFIDAFLWPAVDEACQQIGEIGLRIDAIQLAGLDQ